MKTKGKPFVMSALRSFNHSILLVWMGYASCAVLGMTLWPQIMEWGYSFRDKNYFIATILMAGCLPISIGFAYLAGQFFIRCAHSIDGSTDISNSGQKITIVLILSVMTTLGSCGVIASGYEPPEPLNGIYELKQFD